MSKFLNISKNLLINYEKCIVKHPIKTASISGFTISMMGDIVCQNITNYGNFDYIRTIRYASIGIFMTPQVLYWYRFIDRYLKSTKFKVLNDQLFFSPYDIILTFSINTLLIGGNYLDIKDKIYNDFPQTYFGNILFWSTFLTINFKYIPLNYRLIFSNCGSFIYNIYLSYKVNK